MSFSQPNSFNLVTVNINQDKLICIVSDDKKFLFSSTYYQISPILLCPSFISSNLGSISNIVRPKVDTYKKILARLDFHIKNNNTRINRKDLLLPIRILCEVDDSFKLDDSYIDSLMEKAIEQDDKFANHLVNLDNELSYIH